MVYKYVIPEIPPSNNEYIGKNKRWQYSKDKQYWADRMYLYTRCNVPKTPIEKSVITIKYFFKNKARRDPDNYSGKFILDGLRKAGVIEDDSFRNITLVLQADYDKDDPRTEITIEVIEWEN